MFHFPTFPPNTLFHSGAGDWTRLQPGFPIRTPPDQRSVANSPGLIAGSHVLHRLSVPRHPPCALHSLPNKQQTHAKNTHNYKTTQKKMLTSTIQFSTNTPHKNKGGGQTETRTPTRSSSHPRHHTVTPAGTDHHGRRCEVSEPQQCVCTPPPGTGRGLSMRSVSTKRAAATRWNEERLPATHTLWAASDDHQNGDSRYAP